MPENKPAAIRLRAAVEDFFSTIQTLSWDTGAGHAYGRLRAWITAAGKSLSAMDMLTGAHAVATNAILVTHDKGFLQISPLVNRTDRATDL